MKHHFSIAIQLYSVRGSLSSDFEGVLKRISEMGYDGVEFAGLYGHFPPEVKAICQKYGLNPVSAHVPFIDLISNPDLLYTYADIGCKYIVIPFLQEEYRPGSPLFHTFLDEARMLGRKAAELGLRLCYHNQSYEFQKLADEYALDYIYRSIPSSLLTPELDTCWIHIAGEDPAAYMRRYSDRELLIHLKDTTGRILDTVPPENASVKRPACSNNLYEFCPLGMGTVDIPSILDAADDIGVHWLFVEQDSQSFGLDELQSAEKSIRYLKSLLD